MNGTHVSIEGGLDKAVTALLSMQCTAGQIYLHNPKSYYRDEDPLSLEIEAVRKYTLENRLIVHASYICVLTNDIADGLTGRRQSLAIKGLAKDLEYCDKMGIDGVVVHPGRMKTLDDMMNCAKNLRHILMKSRSRSSMILLENACHSSHGQLSNLSEIRSYLDYGLRDRVGVCLDTAHFWAAGHDVTDLGMFEMDILPYRHLIKAVHFNNPKNLRGSHRDGHGKLAEGVLNSTQLRDMYCKLRELLGETVPFVVEATDDYREIKAMRIWQTRRKEISGKLEEIPSASSTSVSK